MEEKASKTITKITQDIVFTELSSSSNLGDAGLLLYI